MTPRPDLDGLARHLRSGVRHSTALPWGDRRATWRLDLEDGRSIAATVMTGPGARRRAEQQAEISARIRQAGLAVAGPVDLLVDGQSVWLLSPWVGGRTGANLIDGDEAEAIARTMGALSRSLSRIDVEGLDLDGPWARAATLRPAAGSWMDAVNDRLDEGIRKQLRDALDRIADERTYADHGAHPLLRHGDFAPINVTVEPGGRGVLLDFEHVRATALPIDAAWWAWVVGHHHPAAWRRIGASFLAAAGIADDAMGRRQLADLGLLLLLERAADAAAEPDDVGAGRWIHRLTETAALGGLPAYDGATT